MDHNEAGISWSLVTSNLSKVCCSAWDHSSVSPYGGLRRGILS